jgi:hypothetical protein
MRLSQREGRDKERVEKLGAAPALCLARINKQTRAHLSFLFSLIESVPLVFIIRLPISRSAALRKSQMRARFAVSLRAKGYEGPGRAEAAPSPGGLA